MIESSYCSVMVRESNCLANWPSSRTIFSSLHSSLAILNLDRSRATDESAINKARSLRNLVVMEFTWSKKPSENSLPSSDRSDSFFLSFAGDADPTRGP